MMARTLGGLTALSAALVVMLGAGAARAEKDRYDVGEAVPSFTLKALNADDLGESFISLENYFGANAKTPKKAILLSFFATYCEPCKREMPLLAALYDAYKAKGLQIMLVSIDKEQDKMDFARDLAKKSGVKFPVLSDRYNIVAKRYFISKLPNVYLLNGEGKVAMVNVGYNEDISRALVDEIRKSLGEPTSEPLPEAVAKEMSHAGSSAPASVPAAVQEAAPAANAPPATAAAPAEDVKNKNKKPKGKGKKK